MEINYLNSRTQYIDGIPAYKYGEWNGIKPNKFHPTRKIIHPTDHGIFIGCKYKKLKRIKRKKINK
jgi:hypothetical protein